MLFIFLCLILSLPYFIGIVIKYENMTYQDAIHSASIVLSLSSKASKYIKEIFDPPDVNLLLISLMLFLMEYLCVVRMKWSRYG